MLADTVVEYGKFVNMSEGGVVNNDSLSDNSSASNSLTNVPSVGTVAADVNVPVVDDGLPPAVCTYYTNSTKGIGQGCLRVNCKFFHGTEEQLAELRVRCASDEPLAVGMCAVGAAKRRKPTLISAADDANARRPIVCLNYLTDTCHRPDCRFLHLPPDIRPLPMATCEYFLRGNCTRDRCRFFHGTADVLKGFHAQGVTMYNPMTTAAYDPRLSATELMRTRQQQSVAPPTMVPPNAGIGYHHTSVHVHHQQQQQFQAAHQYAPLPQQHPHQQQQMMGGVPQPHYYGAPSVPPQSLGFSVPPHQQQLTSTYMYPPHPQQQHAPTYSTYPTYACAGMQQVQQPASLGAPIGGQQQQQQHEVGGAAGSSLYVVVDHAANTVQMHTVAQRSDGSVYVSPYGNHGGSYPQHGGVGQLQTAAPTGNTFNSVPTHASINGSAPPPPPPMWYSGPPVLGNGLAPSWQQ